MNGDGTKCVRYICCNAIFPDPIHNLGTTKIHQAKWLTTDVFEINSDTFLDTYEVKWTWNEPKIGPKCPIIKMYPNNTKCIQIWSKYLKKYNTTLGLLTLEIETENFSAFLKLFASIVCAFLQYSDRN